MNLYLISQTDVGEYDTFDSAVVVARNHKDAKNIHPYDSIFPEGLDDELGNWGSSVWTNDPNNVHVLFIGVASKSLKEGTVVCTSFNAG